jgi:hypothetical protein
MQLRHDAEVKHFPAGVPERKRYLAMAEDEAISYFDAMFPGRTD